MVSFAPSRTTVSAKIYGAVSFSFLELFANKQVQATPEMGSSRTVPNYPPSLSPGRGGIRLQLVCPSCPQVRVCEASSDAITVSRSASFLVYLSTELRDNLETVLWVTRRQFDDNSLSSSSYM